MHPGEGCIQGSLHPGGGGQNPPPIRSYGIRSTSGRAHPTGMHSCTNFYLLNYLLVKCLTQSLIGMESKIYL